ncbi:ribonuclease H-like YkuK family protein [Chryseobacterium oranimense]|uniref:ribonuclease H-like YkuK family protein n=1 Tax=Chryseobacterium oranimense TaxID=421058 RepID=UPI000B1E1B06|nr:ribonuclease H-like YkuK family protein [Chryseobacterium oranimense]
METQQEVWQNMNGIFFRKPITQLVEEAIIREQANGHRLKVCVGSDSHVYGDAISYATAIVFVREGILISFPKERLPLSEKKEKYRRSVSKSEC